MHAVLSQTSPETPLSWFIVKHGEKGLKKQLFAFPCGCVCHWNLQWVFSIWTYLCQMAAELIGCGGCSLHCVASRELCSDHQALFHCSILKSSVTCMVQQRTGRREICCLPLLKNRSDLTAARQRPGASLSSPSKPIGLVTVPLSSSSRWCCSRNVVVKCQLDISCEIALLAED